MEVPPIEPSEGGTMREQLEQHRADPTCAAGHDLMDPLGLVLENRDAIEAEFMAGNMTMEALHQQDLLVLSGIDNLPAQPDGPGDHTGGTSAFLTCVRVNRSETYITNGTSMDQHYAAQAGKETILPSMQLGIDGGGNTGNCDSGYGGAYSRNISWQGSTPLPKVTSPSTAFDLLFAGFDPGASAEKLARRKAGADARAADVRPDGQGVRVRSHSCHLVHAGQRGQ